MLEQYEIDFEAFKYWVLLFGAVAVVSGLYLFAGSESPSGSDYSPLSLYLEDDSVTSGEVTTLYVEYENETVEGADVEMEYPGDYVYIGDTNSEGALSFETREEDFYINTSYNGYNESIRVEVESQGQDSKDGSGDSSDESGESEDGSDGSQDDESDTGDDGEDPSDSDGSDDSGDGSEDDDQQDESGTTGFKLENDPVAEEINQLTLLENGEPVQATVTMNGEELGETASAGTLTFKVPNTQEITFNASDIQDTFSVSGYEEEGPDTGYVQASMTRSGMAYVGEIMTLNASGTESDNPVEHYNWTLDHENFTDTLQGEVVEYTIPEQGPYDITLEVEDNGGFTDTDTGYMKADPEYSGPEMILTSPSEGDNLTAEEEFEFQVDNARTGQEAHIVVDGNREASVPLESGLNVREDPGVTAPLTQEGTQDYWIEVQDSSDIWGSNKREIENSRAYGEFGTFSIENPSDGAELSSPVNFEFTLDLETGVDLRISGTSTDGEEDFSNQTFVAENQNSYTFNQEINSSEYQWQASISVPTTSESESSSQRTLTVQ